MSITEIIYSLSEETLISILIFIGSIVIYVMRKFAFLNQQIEDYKSINNLGRQGLKDEILESNYIIRRIEDEIFEIQQNVENELVEHEIIGLEMAPKFEQLSRRIGDILDDQNDNIIDIDREIKSISTKISEISNISAYDPIISNLNERLFDLIRVLKDVDSKINEESNKVVLLNHEFSMIKQALGVE